VVRIPLRPPGIKYLMSCLFLSFEQRELFRRFWGFLRESSNDSFHTETNLCGICRDRRARVSFAHFGGTAVSARQTEFELGERDA
jgi:hypothetical protein